MVHYLKIQLLCLGEHIDVLKIIADMAQDTIVHVNNDDTFYGLPFFIWVLTRAFC